MPPGRLLPQPIEDGVRRFAAFPDHQLPKPSVQLHPEPADQTDSDKRSSPSLRARSETLEVDSPAPSTQAALDREVSTTHRSSIPPRAGSQICEDGECHNQRISPQPASEPTLDAKDNHEIETIFLEVVSESPPRSVTTTPKIQWMKQSGDQVVLHLDATQARVLNNTISALFHLQPAVETSVVRDRSISVPTDTSHLLHDAAHPDRTNPVRSVRTVRGFHWTLWREIASPAMADDVRINRVLPLVRVDSSSAGDLYELRSGVDRPQLWVRHLDPAEWISVPSSLSPPVYHPENDEYVLYMKDNAASPSWVKRETRKKYERQMEKLNRKPSMTSV
ncbi:hypothetical protein SISNIDRAFT_491186 [Sistotremastrum niveocremeum HHB9708]|uniref:Uncharacterized protein n=1 Tax=Sistotremastrum niveocremeum HHB9708 TaxID=1314777 RepID=A0A164N3Z6_9AGAM|nr:hypothetical protein SISNIDRAFT_491186 [Sistotremastrum niveocremeum HHB9708]